MPKSTKASVSPKASRPRMTGYGVPRSLQGALSWEWARKRFSASHNYWLTTVRPNGEPHAMPVWGIWLDGAWYCSTSATSRKARNLQHNPHCVVCNENAAEAVIVQGTARRMADNQIPPRALANYLAKYGWTLDPKRGPVFVVHPTAVFAMPEKQFPKGATRWTFRSSPSSA
jgi:nitroimidazol reductase NimA-like FMN-containing flavoprotein (pyridoxamine 5'-phosphate oxidase superfamily)